MTQATILSSEVQTIQAKHTGRNYRITIALPYAYNNPDSTDWPFADSRHRWPVVYVLDANWYFGLVTELLRPMAWCGRTADAIVVGIGYAEESEPQEAWREAVYQRAADYTPVRSEQDEKDASEWTRRSTRTGDAENFHKFIRNELIPMVDEKFRTDPSKRILVGHSLGGLFGTYALLHEPELFHYYVLASPALEYGDKFLFEFEEAYSKENKSLQANVFFLAGEFEESKDDMLLTTLLRFVATVEGRDYEGLNMIRRIFNDLNHCEVIAPSFQAGLFWALRK